MHRLGSTRSQGSLRFLLAALAGLLVLGLSSSALAQARGSLVILGLRAPDGDDEAAANATAALRRAARNAGYEVPNDSPALEQSMASFGCDDSLPPTCLTQIANDLHAQRLVVGSVRRHGRGREATLSIEVTLFDVASQNNTGRDQVEVPRAMGHDSDSLSQSATRLIGTIAPAPAVVAPPVSSAPPPIETPVSNPAPVRRYVSYAASGVGGAALITGAVFGVLWASAGGDAAWQNYQVPATAGVDNNDGAAVCRYAATDTSTAGMAAHTHCNSGPTLSAVAWGVGGAGVALVALGVILLVTDHPAEHPTAAQARRHEARPRFGFTPTFSPAYQGATVSLTF